MTMTLPSRTVPAVRPAVGRWWALPPLLSAVFMTTLDFFVVNVALPSARRELDAGATTVQLVSAAYGLAYAASLVVAGRLGDRYGRRRVFTVGLVLFTLASMACGLAPNGPALVAARVVQGVAAALLAPQVLALLGALYPGAARARAFGWYGTTVGLAGVSGQAIGGLLITADPAGLGWRTCFLVNVPIALAALLPLRRVVPESFGPHRPLDLPGAALLAIGLTTAIGPVTHPQWWPAVFVAVPALAAFAARQRRRAAAGREPLLDLRLLADGAFATGLAAIALLFATSAGLSFGLSLILQERHGLSPLTAGAIFTALNAGFFAASPLSTRLGPAAGTPVLALGVTLLTLVSQPLHLLPGLILAGAGMGLTMSPLISTALARVAPEATGQASGLLGTVQELGGVLGAALPHGPAAVALTVPLAFALALPFLYHRMNVARRTTRTTTQPMKGTP